MLEDGLTIDILSKVCYNESITWSLWELLWRNAFFCYYFQLL